MAAISQQRQSLIAWGQSAIRSQSYRGHRSDRTEVMSEDLVALERHVEHLKNVCEVLVKKMSPFAQTPNQTKDVGRKNKKVAEFALGNSLAELAKKFDDFTTLGLLLSHAGDLERMIGTKMTEYEEKIEPLISHLQKLLDVDFPNANKVKRSLTKQVEMLDTFKSKLQQTNRHSMSSGNVKTDAGNADLADLERKVEQFRDNFAAELYELVKKEGDIAHTLLQFNDFQQECLETCLSTRRRLRTEILHYADKCSTRSVFRMDLSEHLRLTGRTIAYPIELIVCGLIETGLDEEGLFRLSAIGTRVRRLKAAVDANAVDLKELLIEYGDRHVLANVLKTYLRELPNPLLTLELYDDWLHSIKIEDNQGRLQALWNVVQKLPQGHRDNLCYLIKFLRLLSNRQEVNKMNASNIAIVLGPNMLWGPPPPGSGNSGDDGNDIAMGHNIQMTQYFSLIVDQLVTYADWFFPGEYAAETDYFISWEKPEQEWPSVNLRSVQSASVATSNIPNGSIGNVPTSTSQESNHDIPAVIGDDNHNMKRSQSNSSLDDTSGSPKPVIRRKGKQAAPLPPQSSTSNPSTDQNSSSGFTSYGAKQQTSSGTTTSSAPSKREGIYIPPSPSQVAANNRAAFFQPQPVPSAAPNSSKVTPPKPPQPTFSKESAGKINASTVVGTTTPSMKTELRHKSSFKNPNKYDSSEGDGLNSRNSVQYSASLPRRFHTENSYKANQSSNKPSIPDVFKVKTSSSIPDQEVPLTYQELTQASSKSNTSSVSDAAKNLPMYKQQERNISCSNKSSVSTFLGGSAKSNVQNDQAKTAESPSSNEQSPSKTNVTSSVGGKKGSGDGAKISPPRPPNPVDHDIKSKPTSTPPNTADPVGGPLPTEKAIEAGTNEHRVRPVPAPRSSLYKEGGIDFKLQQQEISMSPSSGVGTGNIQQQTNQTKERPVIMAKPRDLGKRYVGSSDSTKEGHSRNSSGSGLEESDSGEVLSGASSQNQSRAQSRTDSLVEDIGKHESGVLAGGGISAKGSENSGIQAKKNEEPPESSSSSGNDVTGGIPTSARFRPPRPNPPPPPSKFKLGDSTDM